MTLLTQQAIDSGSLRKIQNRIKQLENRLDRLVLQAENGTNCADVRRIYEQDAAEARSEIEQLENIIEAGNLELQAETSKLNALLESLS